jgi:hypothetical protein
VLSQKKGKHINRQNIAVWGPEEKERKNEEGEGEKKGRKREEKGKGVARLVPRLVIRTLL